MSESERGVRMTGEESVEQDYERDRLVGWTTSEEFVEARISPMI